MAKPYKIPDFRKMYPEASEEVISVLRTSERKMQYQEYDCFTQFLPKNRKRNQSPSLLSTLAEKFENQKQKNN